MVSIPAATRSIAQRTIPITLPEAQALPNLLGRICATMLTHHGYYAATVGGVKTLYVLREAAGR